jgi:hypothetical protein
MIEIEKLIDAFDFTGEQHIAARLAPFLTELAAQLTAKARERAAKNMRGHKSYGEHIGTAVLELNAVADALRKHAAKADAGPVDCKAVNQLGAKCMRTDVHESHTYPPTDPTPPVETAVDPLLGALDGLERGKVYDGAGGSFIVTDDPQRPGAIFPMAVCGIADHYGGDTPDRCKRPPHGRDSNHEGAYSKWPWQNENKPIVFPAGTLKEGDIIHLTATTSGAMGERTPNPEALAYLRGERDDLGTEPLFIEPRGTVTVTGVAEGGPVAMTLAADSPEAQQITASVLKGFSVGIENPRIVKGGPVEGGPVILEATVTPVPDPFDNALPDPPKRSGVWTGGAEPVEPDPRPFWLPERYMPVNATHDLPTSIRTTQVRVGEACGLQYRLISRDGVPEVPSWANIGGSAVHACAQQIEQAIINGGSPSVIHEGYARTIWTKHFALQIAEVEKENPFPRSTWRRAGKGAEGEDWWNEVGPLMVRDYSAASAQWHAEGWSILSVPQSQRPPTREYFPPIPAMELEMHTPLMIGELTGHLDQAWFRPDPSIGENGIEIRVRDLKSGRELPEDDWQLEAYAFGLRHHLMTQGFPHVNIAWSTVYYDARNGKDGEIKTPRMDTPEIVYRAGAVLGMHAANNYPANPGSDWKAPCYVCAVRYACPIMALK